MYIYIYIYIYLCVYMCVCVCVCVSYVSYVCDIIKQQWLVSLKGGAGLGWLKSNTTDNG